MTTRLGRVAGCLAIAFATARCADKIAPPTASAGAAVTADVGSSVSLDGTQSKDPQGRALAYDWTFASRPAASRASFNDAHIATPSFVPDLDGQYAVSLVVSNGVLSSPASQVMVTVRRCGQAAPDIRSVTASSANPNVENSVQLSADVHDADNDSACALGQTRTLLWTAVSRPGASRNALSDPTADRPTIVPDEVGTYQFSVVATDSTGLQSEPRFVSFTTTNCGFATPTVVSAAASATAPNPGDVVTLSAVVQDADNIGTCASGQTFHFEWSVSSRPAGSSATLSDPTAASPSFTPDVPGSYQFSVTVTDSTGRTSNTGHAQLTATPCGSAVPTITSATATPANPNIGTAVALSATAADTDNGGTCNKGQTLTLHWAFVTRPASSSAFLNNPAAQSPSFTPDVVGTYQFSVTARDGTGNTSPSTFVGVTTTNCGTHAPSVTILSGPPSPVPGTAILVAAVVTDDDNFGTCNLGETFTFAWSLARPPASGQEVHSVPCD